jgi:molecular chaperone GrpE (heat shock protein)
MTRSPQELAAQKAQAHREQEKLLKDLLGVLDSLDSACNHWDQARQEQIHRVEVTPSPPTFFQRLQKLISFGHRTHPDVLHKSNVLHKAVGQEESVAEVVSSAHEGLEMIRRSLLEVLHQRQVIPLDTLGQPFDPAQMYALGRQECEGAVENTVVQEVIRGYRWQNRILREAQVMVAAQPLSKA